MRAAMMANERRVGNGYDDNDFDDFSSSEDERDQQNLMVAHVHAGDVAEIVADDTLPGAAVDDPGNPAAADNDPVNDEYGNVLAVVQGDASEGPQKPPFGGKMAKRLNDYLNHLAEEEKMLLRPNTHQRKTLNLHRTLKSRLGIIKGVLSPKPTDPMHIGDKKTLRKAEQREREALAQGRRATLQLQSTGKKKKRGGKNALPSESADKQHIVELWHAQNMLSPVSTLKSLMSPVHSKVTFGPTLVQEVNALPIDAHATHTVAFQQQQQQKLHQSTFGLAVTSKQGVIEEHTRRDKEREKARGKRNKRHTMSTPSLSLHANQRASDTLQSYFAGSPVAQTPKDWGYSQSFNFESTAADAQMTSIVKPDLEDQHEVYRKRQSKKRATMDPRFAPTRERRRYRDKRTINQEYERSQLPRGLQGMCACVCVCVCV
jgi:hypothetical protein